MKHICFCDPTEQIAPLWKRSSRVFQMPHNQNVSFFIRRFNLPQYPSFLLSIRPSLRCSPFPLLLVLHILFTRLKHKAPRHLIHPPLFSHKTKPSNLWEESVCSKYQWNSVVKCSCFFFLLKVNTLYKPRLVGRINSDCLRCFSGSAKRKWCVFYLLFRKPKQILLLLLLAGTPLFFLSLAPLAFLSPAVELQWVHECWSCN